MNEKFSKDEKELVDKYRKLTPENKANALSNLRVALAAQENTRKGMTCSATAAKKPRKKVSA